MVARFTSALLRPAIMLFILSVRSLQATKRSDEVAHSICWVIMQRLIQQHSPAILSPLYLQTEVRFPVSEGQLTWLVPMQLSIIRFLKAIAPLGIQLAFLKEEGEEP